MGLCKCPKRKVTNLFCFEHDVNVCEYCLVSNHERCIVQSYVQWLQDSDYSPICTLCKRLLSEEPTVRLICYDVFHWSCLNNYAQSLPANTAPAGYQCPKCKECIFPPQNLVSPVVDSLKTKLIQAQWAKIGLGQPLIETNENQDQISNVTEDESNGFVIVSKKQKQQELNDNLSTDDAQFNKKPSFPFVHSTTSTTSSLNKSTFNNSNLQTSTSHIRSNKNLDTEQLILNLNNSDRDLGENKYKRRPIFEWLNRLLRSRQLPGQRMGPRKRFCFILIIMFISFLTLIIIFSRLGAMKTDNDPFLDPMNNPNIRVE